MKKNKIIIYILVIVFLLSISGVFIVMLFGMKDDIILRGESSVQIKLNGKYEDEGVDGNKNVKVTGDVDSTKVGKYEIVYKTDKTTLVRTVEVVDDVKPVITLIGGTDIYLYKGNTYIDDKAVASDNYDGDLTDKIDITDDIDINTVGDYKITYKVSDSSSNTAIEYRNVHVIDENVSMKKVPVLMYHFFYDSSVGETARDNNWIDVSKFEEQIKYLVDNNYYFPTWNEVEMYLDKKIKLPEKSIVITVDDGDPSFFKYGTKILEKYKVKSTSFIITGWYNPKNYEYDPLLVDVESHTHEMHVGGCDGKGKFLCIDREKGINDLNISISVVGSSMVFCYPFGHNNEHTKSILKEVGFHMAFTTVEGKIAPGMDKLTLPRVRVSGRESMDYFIRSIN